MRRALFMLALAGCGSTDHRAPSVAPKYYLVGPAGARDADGVELAPGFGLLIVAERADPAGHDGRQGRSKNGRWVQLSQLQLATPSGFAGAVLHDVVDVGWTIDKGVSAFTGPLEKSVRRLLPRHTLLRKLTLDPNAPGWLASGKEWFRAADVRRAMVSARPAVVGPTERWIDVDLASSTLVAYEGDRPVFATLVSAGIGRPGSPIATPPGVHRIFAKLPTSDMSNAGHTGVVPYAYEAVPHVQYFVGSMALHGALWHDRFGQPASHGCVNLAPADAARLYDFTANNTVVRVR